MLQAANHSQNFNFSRSLLVVILFFLGLTTLGIGSTDYQYPVVLLCFLVFILFQHSVRFNLLIVWGGVVFLLWFYGIAVGVIRGNNPEGIVRNFAGMVLYLPFALIVSASKISLERLISYFNFLAVAYAPIAFYFIFSDYKGVGSFKDVGVSAFRFYYSIGIFIYFPVFSVFLFGLFFGTKSYSSRKNNLGAFLGVIFLIASASKGFFISFVLLVSIIVLSSFFKSVRRGTTSGVQVAFLILCFLVLSFFGERIVGVLDTLINLERDPSHPRVVQSLELVKSFSTAGIGLGGVLDSGYTRDSLGYGMELTYHAILSKFGIIAGVLAILLVTLPLFVSIFRLIVSPMPRYAFSLACSVFLVAAWGNPFIFAPLMVLMSCLAMDLSMRKNYE